MEEDINKTELYAAFGLILEVSNAAPYAATLNAVDTLTITPGAQIITSSGGQVIASGSYYGMEDRWGHYCP